MKLTTIFYRFKKQLLCDHEWNEGKCIETYVDTYFPGCAKVYVYEFVCLKCGKKKRRKYW